MIAVTTHDGKLIKVEDDTDAATIETLKAAPVILFSEFHYTGNSSKGENHANYQEMYDWFSAAGLKLIEDRNTDDEPDAPMLLYYLEGETGVHTLQHRGKTLRYHVQVRRGQGHMDMGYTTHAEYRLISCERTPKEVAVHV